MHDLLMVGAARWQVEAELKRRASSDARPIPSASEIDAAYAEAVDRWISDVDQTEEELHAYYIAMCKWDRARSNQINDIPTAARIAEKIHSAQEKYAAKREAATKRPQRESRIAKLRARKPTLKAVN
ncbi:MAG: hypothetical protein VBE63_15240 [Lamprobacter sp.]|uniref:hypothetical protein n=1 Tax=Lamprobacter sp. TaxID=3100796 RepID=UPI002B25908B|nr:hypothetical protein [Lamprobacter sp.]MEA3641278.1 hypothetical protein [Lamprobacter sp.]